MPDKHLDKQLAQLRYQSSAHLQQRVYEQAKAAWLKGQKQSIGPETRTGRTTEISRAPWARSIGRIMMQAKYRKIAAIVVLVLVVVPLTHIFDEWAAPVYAIEQTIQASHGVRFLRVKSFMAPMLDVPIECWIEFELSGQVKNIRIHKPAWMDPADGDTVIVWKNHKATWWIKKKNFLITSQDQEFAAMALTLAEQLNPRQVATNIQQVKDDEEAKVEIDEPENKAEPITITVTSLVENDFPFERVILLVDQATKLLNSVEMYELKEGEYIPFSTVEFYDYNIPIDAKMFTFDDLPENVIRMDETTQEVGLVQGDLTENEIAVEVVRQFFEALIARDYAKAGLLTGATPAERIQEKYGHIRFVRIVSLGEPALNPETRELNVPYVVEIEENGIITKWNTKHNHIPVRQVHGQPGRWAVTGAPLGL